MNKVQGVIYILTNPSFPEYVKIGYADDMEQRLAQLNRSECTPFAFRVYATYEVPTRLTDMKIYAMIDKLNPSLRAIDTVEGKRRVREFYAMTAEDAYSLFEAMAEIHGTQDKLKRAKPTKAQKQDEELAANIQEEAKERQAPFRFSMVNIPVGAELEFCNAASEKSGEKCIVADDRNVEFEGKVWSLSALARELSFDDNSTTKHSVAGPRYFKYQGKWLNDIRKELGV